MEISVPILQHPGVGLEKPPDKEFIPETLL